MAQNPQEQYQSTIDTQQTVAERSLNTHNGYRPSQGDPAKVAERRREIDAVMNGGLKK